MSGLNKVILIGRLGKNPEVRHLEGGATVANFSLATSETYKDKNTGEKVENTEWHNCQAWRGLAEVIEQYVKKGDQISIEGKLKTRSWTDKDGSTRYTTEIVVDNMIMLGGRREGSGNASTQSNSSWQGHKESDLADTEAGSNDDLPF